MEDNNVFFHNETSAEPDCQPETVTETPTQAETVNAAPCAETEPAGTSELPQAPAAEFTGTAEPPRTPAAEPAAAPAWTEQGYAQTEERSAYADAGYIPAAAAGAMPKSYHCAASEPRQKRERAPRRGMRPAAVVALCLVCAILGGLTCGLAPRWLAKQTAAEPEAQETVRSVPAAAGTAAAAETGTEPAKSTVLTLTDGENKKTVTASKAGTEMSATDIYYNLALDQVVVIKVEMEYTSYFGYSGKSVGYGSGFIISDDGYILTNYHVIANVAAGSGNMEVIMSDDSSYEATIIGYDEDHDVALLKIDATGLNAAVLGDSDEMLVGEDVYVVGNPTGQLEYSMAEGIVSAKDRTFTAQNTSTGKIETVNTFQTTAAINGGNSGGPVYNSRGEVIGIVIGKRVSTDVEGIGYAIPINDAVRIAQDLINDGYVRGKAYLGVRLGTVTASAAQYYGLVQGAIVASVEEGTAAQRAGLKESDIIVAMDDKEVTSADELIDLKKNYSAGDSAVLKIYREGQYQEISVTFDEMTPEVLNTDSNQESEEPEETRQPSGGYRGLPFGN